MSRWVGGATVQVNVVVQVSMRRDAMLGGDVPGLGRSASARTLGPAHNAPLRSDIGRWDLHVTLGLWLDKHLFDATLVLDPRTIAVPPQNARPAHDSAIVSRLPRGRIVST